MLPAVSLTSSSLSLSQTVLVDSGADANFMGFELANQLNLPPLPLAKPIDASALDGRLLCHITHHTPPVRLTFPDSHSEELCFHLYQAPLHPLILGYPWLCDHNPHINWATGKAVTEAVFPSRGGILYRLPQIAPCRLLLDLLLLRQTFWTSPKNHPATWI